MSDTMRYVVTQVSGSMIGAVEVVSEPATVPSWASLVARKPNRRPPCAAVLTGRGGDVLITLPEHPNARRSANMWIGPGTLIGVATAMIDGLRFSRWDPLDGYDDHAEAELLEDPRCADAWEVHRLEGMNALAARISLLRRDDLCPPARVVRAGGIAAWTRRRWQLWSQELADRTLIDGERGISNPVLCRIVDTCHDFDWREHGLLLGVAALCDRRVFKRAFPPEFSGGLRG
jgi:hypothetical protein